MVFPVLWFLWFSFALGSLWFGRSRGWDDNDQRWKVLYWIEGLAVCVLILAWVWVGDGFRGVLQALGLFGLLAGFLLMIQITQDASERFTKWVVIACVGVYVAAQYDLVSLVAVGWLMWIATAVRLVSCRLGSARWRRLGCPGGRDKA